MVLSVVSLSARIGRSTYRQKSVQFLRRRRTCGRRSYDPQLGPVLLFGSGGVMVEVYNDVALRRRPIMRSEAQAMIAVVNGARLLRGFCARPAADLAALADTLSCSCPSSPCTRRDT
jgi:hypothetical protein